LSILKDNLIREGLRKITYSVFGPILALFPAKELQTVIEDETSL
jgi:hypothetical protein